MPRREKHSLREFLELLAFFPWWVGIVLAPISYVLISPWVQPEVAGASPSGALVGGMALAAQYVVPGLCIFAGLASFFGRRKREALLNGVAQSPAARALEGVSWFEFEQLVGESFRREGYAVEERGGDAPDGGVDLVLRKDGVTWLVQCKQWKTYRVGVGVVRELYGVVAAEGATGGIVVTSGNFTDDARDFATGKALQLIDGDALMRRIHLQVPRGGAMQPKPSLLQGDLLKGVAVVAVGAVFVYAVYLGLTSSAAFVEQHKVMSERHAAEAKAKQKAAKNRYAELMEAQRAAKEQGEAQAQREALEQANAEATQIAAEEAKEKAWIRHYRAPAGCDSPPSWEAQVACGNHYIRERKKFDAAYPR